MKWNELQHQKLSGRTCYIGDRNGGYRKRYRKRQREREQDLPEAP